MKNRIFLFVPLILLFALSAVVYVKHARPIVVSLERLVSQSNSVRERLFPQELPVIEGLDFFGACRPALGVGGDYYDFLELPENRFGIAIGDISGKGIGASLMMASLQASIRGQTLHFGNDLGGLMSQINGLVYEASTTNRYATFFHASTKEKCACYRTLTQATILHF
ncbi:MAG: SpoIIE family protein phosphatase [Acidobacteriota bacterium]